MIDLENKINYTFKNKLLLKQAFTHSSIDKNNYERLEFLGDSIITFFTSEWLYKKFISNNEGQLTIKRSQLVNKNYISKISKSLELYNYLNIQKKTTISDRIHTDIYESLVGAIYIDSGYKYASEFLNKTLIEGFTTFAPHIDYKGTMLAYNQKQIIDKIDINTSLLKDSTSFISTINIDDEYFFYGFGQNKISAEQRASKLALNQIKKINTVK